MRNLVFVAATLATLAAAAPASAQEDFRLSRNAVAVAEDGRPVFGGSLRINDDRDDWRDDRRDYRRDRRRPHYDDQPNHGERRYRDGHEDYRDDRRDYREGRRYDDRFDDRRAFQQGFHEGRRFDDRFEDRRVYRQGYRDGRLFGRYDYRPFFGPRHDLRRHGYSRYDFYDGPWRRPYVIGRPLPHGVGYRRIDPYYYGGLPPCPRGYYYADVAGDILLIALASGIVADALLY